MNTVSASLQSLRDHPVISAALGLAPLLAMAQTLLSAALMALSFSAALIFSMLSLSWLRSLVPHDYRLPFILLISSSWVTAIDILLQTFFYEMRTGLDFYIPLIAMNSLLLWMLEVSSLKRSLITDIIPASFTCILVIIICVISGGIREILSEGKFLSDINLLFPDTRMQMIEMADPAWTLPIMATSSGALLILGCILAGMNLAISKYNEADDAETQIVPATASGEDGIEQ